MNTIVKIISIFGFIFIPKLSSSKNLSSPAPVAGGGADPRLRLSLLLLKIQPPVKPKLRGIKA